MNQTTQTETITPLRSQQLTKRYGEIQALAGISLDIGPGVTAILGQNGAGKTTFIKCALGLEVPGEGTINVFGGTPRIRNNRKRVGAMLQDTELPDLLTGRELLTLFASYYPEPLELKQLIALTQIESFVDQRYKKLSGGQKRRIQFALAIVGNPDLVFLDEPTTGLDSGARKALWETVRGFAAEGRSIVLTTHYLEEAEALADRVVIFREGQIIADDSVETIRAGVGGALISCSTKLSTEQLSALPAVTNVQTAGRLVNLRSSNTVTTLRTLIEQDSDLQDLTVSKPRLEDIFEELSS